MQRGVSEREERRVDKTFGGDVAGEAEGVGDRAEGEDERFLCDADAEFGAIDLESHTKTVSSIGQEYLGVHIIHIDALRISSLQRHTHKHLRTFGKGEADELCRQSSLLLQTDIQSSFHGF